MHFHYSNVSVTNSIMTNNYRGAQFQESLVTMSRNIFYDNKSGVQARDSEVVFEHNEVINNQNGANFFRLDLNAHHNIFANNEQDGLRIREGATQIKDNQMFDNRFGLLVADANYADVQRNFLGANFEAGSERGIAVISYSGLISQNNIFANGLYGIGLEGISDIEAQENWWDDSDLAQEIYDSSDEAGLGTVRYKPQSHEPYPFTWAWQEIPVDAVWGGIINISENVTVAQSATLQVRPGSTVRFGSGVGLKIFGSIESKGTKDNRITYTSMESKEPGFWDEINLFQAGESSFVHSDFSYGTWGIHSHFTSLEITGCRFTNNDGGIRFRSGPLEVSGSVFKENRIGIRSFRGIAEISRNEITANEIGIFVRQKGAGLAIHYNNIYANERYALRLGDFNLQEVDARHNWWNGEDLGKIIFDQADESYIGPVLIDPVLSDRMDIIVQ
jgi:hypothetical protein